ncbi:hypothetical protein HK405_015109 [Cladochytrium tenue]|nr:hypothetical protein HK405_015109 [Cladochytrium tenue]
MLTSMPATAFLEVAALLSLRELLRLRLGCRRLRLAVDGLAFSSLAFARRHNRCWLARSLPDHHGPIEEDDDATSSQGSEYSGEESNDARDVALADCSPDHLGQYDIILKEWRVYQESPERMRVIDDTFHYEVMPPRQDYWEPGPCDKAWPTFKRVTSLDDFESEIGFGYNEDQECVSLFDAYRGRDKSW